ncbi:MAG TPA: ABC transporter substrate-binding protein [Acidimicrobiales bacterium]|nr:ABC transporter substrate-binding protein [Acidimicrobiales bacterium]
MRRTSSRFVGVLAVLVAIAGACSSDRGDDPAAAGDAPDSGEADGGDGGDGAAGDTFGTLDSPCGEGDATAGGDQGVTDDQVVIGYGDDAGYPQSPGLSHETSHAIEAMIDWCNEQGGINGREIVGNYYDAAITNVVNAMTQACGEVFMLVGEAWAFDSGQEETRVGCGLPAVPTYAVSPAFANGPMAFQPVPNPADMVVATAAADLAELHPDEVKKAAIMYGNFAATKDTREKVLQSFPDFGFEFIGCDQEYNIAGEPDWKPFAQKLKDCGVELVYYIGQAYPNLQNLLDDAAQIGFEPVWLADSNNYLQSFADWNVGGNGDNVYVRMNFAPFESAEEGSATQTYVDIVEAHDGDISQLGQQATSAFLLWATAASRCDELSRDCVVDELSKITSWDGGGLHPEANPGENLPPECQLVVKLDGTEWVQVAPEEPGEFTCDPDGVVELSGPVVDQAELDENRISTVYLP